MYSQQALFAGDHPDYLAQGWYFTSLLAGLFLLSALCAWISRKDASPLENPALAGIFSGVTLVLEILSLQAAAQSQYYTGMLISDYGMTFSFAGGWITLVLLVVCAIVTLAQVFLVLLKNLSGRKS